MPDQRKHRGKHPDDDRLFAEPRHDALRKAVGDYSWLLTRDYAEDAALKLVGDHFGLTVRQRMAVRRSACSDASLRRRRETELPLDGLAGRPIGVDGYNLLITVESALSGGLILVGRDGCRRDLASVHGTYRKVEETIPAVRLIIDFLATLNTPRVDWYLDKPVSNSGRLKVLMAEVIRSRAEESARCPEWNIELVPSPDSVLSDGPDPVVTSDSVVLDLCGAWLNVAAGLIDLHCPNAWVVDLRA